ncbi:unnamed protein product [Darwinula stevensoni]|uniref:Enolase n=1 Tax=Darwinula stevensoni TaxID=69355 RepID=A0A7R9A8C1_9CRUS|nr:unnamed protein product [Darwinula stevensoni]CAG0896214.1 unnamed protein product [Darwinula stevensoni]
MTSSVFNLGFLLSVALVGNAASIGEDYGELELVHLLYRHGERSPIVFYPNDPYKDPKYWPVGPGQLLNPGKERHFKLGGLIRKRYEGFLNPMYDESEVLVRSTDYDRTLMSAQANLAGLYPPQGNQIWNPNLAWQPIPIHTVPVSEDYLLFPDSTCRAVTEEMDSLKDRYSFVRDLMDRAKKVLVEIQTFTGLDPNENVLGQVDSLSDTLAIEASLNYTLPLWANGIYPNEIKPISVFSYMLVSFTPKLKRLRGGPLVYTMVKQMEDKVAGKPEMKKRKLFVYSGHDSTISAFLSSLNVFDPQQPSYASMVTVELREKNGLHYVRVMYRNETGEYNLRIPGCSHLCRLEEFTRLTESVRISPQQWSFECQNQDSSFSNLSDNVKKMPIQRVKARQIFGSKGNPMLEVDVVTEKGLFRAAVPSDTSIQESLEFRDKVKGEYPSKVKVAVKHINEVLGPAIVSKNFDPTQQEEIDKFLMEEERKNKLNLGVNAMLGISAAICKAGAIHKGLPLYRYIAKLAGNTDIILPVPAFIVINGGSHANNRLAMQDFMILPTGASSFHEAVHMGSKVCHHLRKEIKDMFGLDAAVVGDEGGFAPNILNNKDALQLISDAIAAAGYTGKVEISMDVAASAFHKDGLYDLDFKNPKSDKSKWLQPDQLADLYDELIEDFSIISIEDPFDRDHLDAWTKMCKSIPIQIVGDNLTMANPNRIQMAVDRKACNCLLLKVNQMGSVTEAIQAHNLAKKNGWGTMVSYQTGETEDTFFADFVVGLSSGQIKTGAPCQLEWLARYNQIIRIEEELGPYAQYAGKNFRHSS